MNGKNKPEEERFESVLQTDVPQGRDGKHKDIVTRLLKELKDLKQGSALKIPLSQLPDTKENIRAALSRAARHAEIPITTSSKGDFLYLWRNGHEES